MILVILICAYLVASLMEYILHRYYLHKESGHPHITEHHVTFHGKRTYENMDTTYKDIVSNIWYILASWLPCLLVGSAIYRINTLYGVIFTSTGGLYLIWVEVGHYLFHKPHGYFIEGFTLFKDIKEHHKIHHTYYQNNFGIGSSVWDYLLKTKK